MRMNILSSGIPSLGKIIDGGFNQGDVIPIPVQAHAGKSILGVQFIHDGAAQHDELGGRSAG